MLHERNFQRALFAEDFQRVERSLDRRAHGPFLDVRTRHFVALAELVDQPSGIGLGIVSGEEIIFSGEDVVDAGPTRLHEQRGSDPAPRSHAAEVKGFLHVLGVAIPCPEPGGLVRGVAQHPAHLPGV